MLVHSKRLLYLHPSKTGGTSVENSLIKSELGEISRDHLNNDQLILYGLCYDRNMTHWNYEKWIDNFPFLADWSSFVTVRHPYDRVVSEWKYQVSGNRRGTSEFHKEDDLNGAIQYGAIVRHRYHYHWMPQISYVGPETTIIRLENIDEEWDNLGLNIGKLKHLNASKLDKNYELTDESKQIIQDAFPNDFEELGYDR